MMVYTVPAGQVGVLWKRFSGTVLDRTLGSGLHIIAPWDRIYIYNLRIQIIDHHFDVLTADGLKITVNIAYRFWLSRNGGITVDDRDIKQRVVVKLHHRAGEDGIDAAIGLPSPEGTIDAGIVDFRTVVVVPFNW